MMDKEVLLSSYFSNSLSEAEQKLFDELLNSDSEFKAQFDFEHNLKRAIQDKEAQKLKAKLVSFEKDVAQETTVRSLRPAYSKWAMAASVALLVTLGWLGYTNFSGPNYSDLYEANFQQYPNTVYTITRGESVQSIERDAFSAYETGNYETAIVNFNKIPQAARGSYFDFYLAQSHLNLGQIVQAKISLEKTISQESEFAGEAHWYLAMIALKEKDKANAINQLKVLTTKYDYNKDMALALLKELE